MDFFNAQDQARRNTGRLVLFFTLAVLSLIVMTNLLVMAVFGYLRQEVEPNVPLLEAIDWEVFGIVSAGVIIVIGLSSLYKIMALSGGGESVAEMMGGKLIVDGTGDPDRQKILNVVEEMAIASGSPVPPVYLLEEEGINAFAAGYTTGDAIIGVTRGAIKKLSRDELQGVIAHEFSHIHNGDMRLNIKLIGVLHGILVLGMIGYYILRSSAYSRSSSRKSGGGAMFLGLGLVVIGYAGTFFGNLIKAAVSRQREFLADASAVQFTRNPDGIGGALQRIAADSVGSILANPNTSEISHALFSQGFTSSFAGLFATHPPLDVRIKKILPGWDGNFEPKKTVRPPLSTARKAGGRDESFKKTTAILTGMSAAIDHIGNPSEEHLGYSARLIAGLPGAVKHAVHEPYGARAVVYCLLLDEKEELKAIQLEHLAREADTGVYDETVRLAHLVQRLPAESRLPLLDMAMPALRQLSTSQYVLFKKNVDVLIRADGKLSLFEWTLQKILFHRLDGQFEGRSGKQVGTTTLRKSSASCSILLSLLVYSTRQEKVSHDEVFDAAARQLPGISVQLLTRGDLSFSRLDQAINELAGLMPQEKRQLVKACAASVLADREVDPIEVELVRAIADTLDCPMPPLLDIK